ncbi:hypothetical protein CC78DRAFT_529314 [Lojkania enalia]|uniref:Uncharacterized protein n=1 Tax=Lojkania enalia TaxID=147567 RepID=A0A9P4NAF8_9PLEO|nr:hypothetical protein CC78DRAFT_529314 [Didymosphaeria enalia]
MGGQAFAKAGPNGSPLNVPRMPLETYEKMAAVVKTELEHIFRHVDFPREAPGKHDFGDIDVLVEGSIGPWTHQSIKEAIGGLYHLNHGGTHTYAVPHPDITEAYVQVDVEISPGNDTSAGPELFEWTMFMKSDSDLMQIIGICHRSLGLTCNDKGFHVRVEQLEPYNKQKSLLFLTRDPDKAIAFYGLDVFKYKCGFETEDELFDWISQGQFFSRTMFRERTEKANDRQRLRKRPMYGRFIEEYMPAHPEAGTDGREWTREEVLGKALDTFQKHEQYHAMIKEHEIRENEMDLWRRIKEHLPLEGKSLGFALKGLKRWVDFKDGQPYILSEPILEDHIIWSRVTSNEDQLMAWITLNYAQVKALEKARSVSCSHDSVTESSKSAAL